MKHWTAQEDALLCAHVRAGASVPDVTRATGRSANAVLCRLKLLQRRGEAPAFQVRARRPWVAHEDGILLDGVREGIPARTIARTLGRTLAATQHRIKYHARLAGASAIAPAPGRAARPGPRPCLCCGKTFTSEGAHNRLCAHCRSKSASPFDTPATVRHR